MFPPTQIGENPSVGSIGDKLSNIPLVAVIVPSLVGVLAIIMLILLSVAVVFRR